MRVAQVRWRESERVAVVDGGAVSILAEGPGVMTVLLAEQSRRSELLAGAEASGVPLSDVGLLPPLVPASVRDFVCFERHLEGMSLSTGDTVPERRLLEPTFYFSNPHAVIGAHDDVEIPPDATQFDYELEIGAVIGRRGRDLRPDEAVDYIAGFTVFNDWTGRDVAQRARADGLHAIKAKDTAITLGPWIVTTDELAPYWQQDMLDLQMTVWRNGAQMGTDRSSSMGWSFGEVVAYASRGAWIAPGDVIGSGTCGGGCLAELWGRAGRVDPPPLVAGDVIRMEVEGIGAIENKVAPARPSPPPTLPIRRLRD